MSEIAQLIQRDIPLGNNIKLCLADGKEISGALTEIGTSHLKIVDRSGNRYTYFFNAIRGWVLPNEMPSDEAVEQTNSVSTKEPAPSSPGETATSDTSTSSPSGGGLSEIEAHRKFAEIETFFDAKVQAVHIEIQAPDLRAPVEDLKRISPRTLLDRWDRIRQRHRYAIDYVNERLPAITTDLKALIQDVPSILSVRRILPYFQYTSGQLSESLKSYKELCLLSQKANDWYNLSAVALEIGDDTLACYALEQVFTISHLDRDLPEWYMYIKLLEKSERYALLRKLYNTLKDKLHEDEEQFFLETCFYILKKVVDTHAVLELVKLWLGGASVGDLLQEIFKPFVEPVSDPYTQITVEMTQLQQELLDSQKRVAPQTKSPTIRPLFTSANNQNATRVSLATGSYMRAKQLLDNGEDPEKAIPLLQEAIEKRDNTASAIKRLASLYSDSRRQKEVISLLKRYKGLVGDSRFVNNMMMEAYWQSAQYAEAVELLLYDVNHRSSNAAPSKLAYRYRQIATCYMHMENYTNAEEWFNKFVKLRKDNIVAQRNIAICMLKQGRHREAEQVLGKLNTDPEAIKLLEGISQARATGPSVQIDKMMSEATKRRQEDHGLSKPNIEQNTSLHENRALPGRNIALFPVLGELEKTLRTLIEKELSKRHGERWLEEAEKHHPTAFQNCRGRRVKDLKTWQGASDTLLDYTDIDGPVEIILSKEYWNSVFQSIFQSQQNKNKAYWERRMHLVVKVRNAVAHHRVEVVPEEQQSLCKEFCEEILQIVNDYFSNSKERTSL